MLISMNWIKDFVNLDGIETDELIKRFNLSTAEIEGVIHKGADIQNVVFARIDKIEKHPNSDRLQVMKLNVGEKDLVQVLTTATNIYEGMKTCFVRVGGMVCGQKIGLAKMGGLESFGMGCSESDLGIGSDDKGLADIHEDVPLGVDIKTYWPIDDVVFEIDNKTLTNRPDLWGHLGLAREFAAIFGRKLVLPKLVDLKKFDKLPKLDVKILDKNCFEYAGVAVENVTRKVSPYEMKIRLCYCGMRDVSFACDLTNYLMLEFGQPMHAFDYDVVHGISVESAKKGTKMLTLEGEEHDIPEGAVVICDNKHEPVAIAGIKGGMKSGIGENTTKFLLESAIFDAVAIRKTSRKIGLSTDASIRYEKSLDNGTVLPSIARLLQILNVYDKGAKVCTSVNDVVSFKYPKVTVDIGCDFIRRRIGIDISNAKIVSILKSLEFEVAVSGDKLKINVPSFRATKDVSIAEDIVEEVARMYGYDNIKPLPLPADMKPVATNVEHVAEYKTKRLLAEKYGASELHSYVWHYADFCKEHGIESKSFVGLLDASNSGQSGLRSELTPSLLKFFVENKNTITKVRIDEIARAFVGLDENGKTIEEKHLCVLFADNIKNEETNLFELKKAIDNIGASIFQVKFDYVGVETKPYLHPKNSAVVKVGEEVLGVIGLIHPSVSSSMDKRMTIAVCELDFVKLAKLQKTIKSSYKLSKYQSVHLDFNFLVDSNMEYHEFEKKLLMFHPKVECEYELKEVFEDEKLGDKKSYLIGAEIYSTEKTLSAEDIDRFSEKLIASMDRLGIKLK